MKKLIFLWIVQLLLIISVVNAYVYTIQNATNPNYPGKCFHESSQLEINPGETMKLPGNCEKVTCNEDFSIDGIGCGFVSPARYPCREIPQDVNKPFPECCATVICPP